MKKSTLPTLCALTLLFAAGYARSVRAEGHDEKRLVATVMFGAGLNTPATSATNHHVVPQTIRIKAGGVVNFVVSGFHQIFVYNPGVTHETIIPPTTGTFINDLSNLYYQGLVPAGGSGNLPQSINPSNASNRVEAVSFSEPGKYLVICNVRGHFLNGMYAYVIVGDADDDHDDDHGEHGHHRRR